MLTEVVCVLSDENEMENFILYETYLCSLQFSYYYIFDTDERYMGRISESDYYKHFITTAEYRKMKIERIFE